jgi:phytoene synthase
MTLAPGPAVWEQKLISLAGEAQRPPARPVPACDRRLLARANAYCRALTAAHSRTFYLASGFLPGPRRIAMRALYAFCRTTDDIVDCTGPQAGPALDRWREHALADDPPPGDLVAVAWANARLGCRIPLRYAEQLIDGVARDLVTLRSSTVGLMSMHIVGFAGPAVAYAVRLGVALQLTNILRDVGEDWRAGRLYLPLDELCAFDLSEADIARGLVDARWRAFMRFQIARTRRLYAEAWPGLRLLNADGRFAVAAAGGLYRAILADIEAHDYDVFTRRAFVPAWDRLRCLPALWWGQR